MSDPRSSSGTITPPDGLAERIELYLDDAPMYGGHSDKAGGSCWELLREAMEEIVGLREANHNYRDAAQQELEPFAWRWQKPFGDVGEWQITKEKPTHAFRMLEPLYVGVAQAAPDALRAAAKRVCWFDWSDNDMSAVAAIDALRKALMVSSTNRGDEA